jgi:hypothetical protein
VLKFVFRSTNIVSVLADGHCFILFREMQELLSNSQPSPKLGVEFTFLWEEQQKKNNKNKATGTTMIRIWPSVTKRIRF